MDWQDDGVILGVRKHGETSAIVSAFTRSHGRHAGLVRQVSSKKLRGIVQPGNLVRLNWHARLEEHLGIYSMELLQSNVAPLMLDPGKLTAMMSACALVSAGVPEHEPHPDLFETLSSLMVALDHDDWPSVYVKWEIGLLAELGFGLDFSQCAATGERDGLVYVSPKTGRAVSAQAGRPYHDRLLALPAFLLTGEVPGAADLVQALKLTGHFLNRHVLAHSSKALPDSRGRLMDRWLKA
ncbi:DNA repair protein RecO [Aestuariispira insulae]|uniref:DNA repair protein RecO n=1 Tax=Aestuariispira insulae TaxID=1461337 RepID=A0A3D9HVF4_9PROT|nr:DNA repair protein RecO [Aestuariispira insulae]RED53409.1 DNA replication and repair protein RecO [Aestuariispira insulae]